MIVDVFVVAGNQRFDSRLGDHVDVDFLVVVRIDRISVRVESRRFRRTFVDASIFVPSRRTPTRVRDTRRFPPVRESPARTPTNSPLASATRPKRSRWKYWR